MISSWVLFVAFDFRAANKVFTELINNRVIDVVLVFLALISFPLHFLSKQTGICVSVCEFPFSIPFLFVEYHITKAFMIAFPFMHSFEFISTMGKIKGGQNIIR